jgi:acetyl esterase/lipase
VTWTQIEALPAPPAGEIIAYGRLPAQFGELRLPEGDGPFPLAVLIHGGCWRSEYGLDYVAPIAADLNEHGVATWAIEYRRLGEAGGGWPGTFDDVIEALEEVESLAASYPIDRERMVLAGHSAGGHLALWVASRERLPAGERWYGALSPGVRGVVAMAPITDLAEYAAGFGDCNASVPPLLGEDSATYAGRLAVASPDRLIPPSVPVHLFQGRVDPIVPSSQATVYVDTVARAGGVAEASLIDDAGHFEFVAPFAEAWRRARASMLEMLGVPWADPAPGHGDGAD